jgi:peptidoglycan-N-acetylmuramic acid deacetylase PdaC-like protein/uncharacterized protein DUF3298
MRFVSYVAVFTVVLTLTILQYSYTPLAQESGKNTQTRYYFIGTVGSGNKVQMELIIDSDDVTGSYYYDKKGIPLRLSGTYNAKNERIKLEEKGDKGLVTGIFSGKLSSEGLDSAKTIEGEWSNRAGDKTLPFKLTKVADFVKTTVSGGPKIESSLLYPKFLSNDPALKTINAELSNNFKTEQDKFLRESKEFFSTNDSAGSWQEDRSYSIAYYSEGLISLTGEVYSYTGGAHGNTYYISSNYAINHSKASLIQLSDLFKPGSNYLKVLSTYCVNDLLLKGAGWIVNGEIKSFSEKELGVFAISPEGIKFAFAPYAVGPYSEGSYFVIVPFRELRGIINPKGPLSQFVGLSSK